MYGLYRFFFIILCFMNDAFCEETVEIKDGSKRIFHTNNTIYDHQRYAL